MIFVLVVSVAALGIVAGMSMWPDDAVSCGAGSDLKSRYCRDAESECRDAEQASSVDVDGVDFAYSYQCKDGMMISFSYGSS